ncbi:MAG TPA: hypothetical protein VLG69_01965 [Candidatus Andersenbacteria bacterium]|nr:hypothetical protein [Candidatus Andersenbacteria bacterium]
MFLKKYEGEGRKNVLNLQGNKGKEIGMTPILIMSFFRFLMSIAMVGHGIWWLFFIGSNWNRYTTAEIICGLLVSACEILIPFVYFSGMKGEKCRMLHLQRGYETVLREHREAHLFDADRLYSRRMREAVMIFILLFLLIGAYSAFMFMRIRSGSL